MRHELITNNQIYPLVGEHKGWAVGFIASSKWGRTGAWKPPWQTTWVKGSACFKMGRLKRHLRQVVDYLMIVKGMEKVMGRVFENKEFPRLGQYCFKVHKDAQIVHENTIRYAGLKYFDISLRTLSVLMAGISLYAGAVDTTHKLEFLKSSIRAGIGLLPLLPLAKQFAPPTLVSTPLKINIA